MSYVPNITATVRSLKQILDDFHCHTQRQYRTIGTGDYDVNISTTNTDKLNVATNQSNLLTDGSRLPTAIKRKPRQRNILNSSQTKEPNVITRTICTRSSTLNTLNNNQQQLNHG